MKMSLGRKSWKWVGLVAFVLAFTILVTDPAFAQSGEGDNPNDCDWQALADNAIVRRDDRIANVGFDEGLFTIEPMSFESIDDLVSVAAPGHNPTDAVVQIADIDCEEIGGGDGWNYTLEGLDGSVETYLHVADPDPDAGDELTFELGLWGFLDDEDETLHTFTILLNAAPAGPNLTLIVVGATFAEEGGNITMSANETMLAPFQWKLDGSDIGGATTATFALIGTTIGDSGLYELEFDDGEAKATLTSNGVGVAIFAAGTLPVGGLIGLALLSTGLLAGGVSLVRRKKA